MALRLPSFWWGSFPPEEDLVSVHTAWGKTIVALLATAVFAASLAMAQQATVEEGKRKIKARSNPAYPELARRLGIAGKVRVEIVIAPDGHVKNARAIGGHPVLVQPCLEAVKEWRFDSAPEETTLTLEFEFKQ
jgi:TonB family protein